MDMTLCSLQSTMVCSPLRKPTAPRSVGFYFWCDMDVSYLDMSRTQRWDVRMDQNTQTRSTSVSGVVERGEKGKF